MLPTATLVKPTCLFALFNLCPLPRAQTVSAIAARAENVDYLVSGRHLLFNSSSCRPMWSPSYTSRQRAGFVFGACGLVFIFLYLSYFSNRFSKPIAVPFADVSTEHSLSTVRVTCRGPRGLLDQSLNDHVQAKRLNSSKFTTSIFQLYRLNCVSIPGSDPCRRMLLRLESDNRVQHTRDPICALWLRRGCARLRQG